MNKSDDIKELATALAKAQSEVENASKSSANPHFKSKYADLAEILNTVRPVFSSHGIAIVQMPSFADGKASVETLLTHSSGQWISNTCSAPVGKQDAQGVGSAITYLRRYSLAAFAGVAQEDDDGNSSIGKQPQQTHAPKPVKSAMPDEALPTAIQAVQSGKFTVQKVSEKYALSESQRQQLIAAETQALAEMA
ncbi:MAG: ERF family protein [Moraxellaceae bacterium]